MEHFLSLDTAFMPSDYTSLNVSMLKLTPLQSHLSNTISENQLALINLKYFAAEACDETCFFLSEVTDGGGISWRLIVVMTVVTTVDKENCMTTHAIFIPIYGCPMLGPIFFLNRMHFPIQASASKAVRNDG